MLKAISLITMRRRIVVACLVAVLADVMILALYDEYSQNVNHSVRIIGTQFIVILPVLIIFGCWIFVGWRKTNTFLHDYRFLLGAGLVAIAVVLNINGSSMGVWNVWLNSGPDSGAVFGSPRLIRTDEYVVGTPFVFSQAHNRYGYFNSIIGDRPSDMFIIKDAPVLALGELFRPFQWGYLIFGSSRGLAFYWSARMVVLALVSYQFFLMITAATVRDAGNRTLSALGTVLVAFSPMVQWWFAVNNIVEMLVAVMLSTVMLSEYCKNHDWRQRLVYALIIMICAGMFLFALYPAWQIPLGYILMAIIIWQIAMNWGAIRMTMRDWCIVIAVLLIFIVICLTVFVASWTTIQATLNTVYPGNRHRSGGGVPLQWLLSAPAGLAMAFKEYVAGPNANGGNATEAAQFIDLFPLGVVLALIALVYRRGRDLLSWMILTILTLFGIYAIFGLPDGAASMTLLSMSTNGRIMLGIGLANIILLIRGAASCKNMHLDSALQTVVVLATLLVVAASAAAMYWTHGAYLGRRLIVVLTVVIVIVCWGVVSRPNLMQRICASIATVFLVCAGCLVNPVRYGISPIARQPLVQMASTIQRQHPGKWVVVGDDGGMTAQLLVAKGLTTLNAVSVTPNMRLWGALDPHGRYEEVYNRYAFITLHVAKNSSDAPELMRNPYPDRIEAWLTASQLRAIGANYVLSSEPLETVRDDSCTFDLLSNDVSGYKAYELKCS